MKQEVHHNEYEQVVGYLRDALKAVQEAEIPEHLEIVAFTKACDMIGAKQLFVSQPAPLALGIPQMDIPKGRNHRR